MPTRRRGIVGFLECWGFANWVWEWEYGLERGSSSQNWLLTMTMDSELARNGSGLTIPAKWVSVEIMTLISVKKHVKVILEKKILAHYMSTCYYLKNTQILIEKWELWNSCGFSVIPVYLLGMYLAVRTDYSTNSSLKSIEYNKKSRVRIMVIL